MTKVTSDMSMSLDGFIAGPNDGVQSPLGDGGVSNSLLLELLCQRKVL